MKVKAVEFINRFVMQVLPCGSYKIRCYRIFANTLCNDLPYAYFSLNDKEMDLSSMEAKNWQNRYFGPVKKSLKIIIFLSYGTKYSTTAIN